MHALRGRRSCCPCCTTRAWSMRARRGSSSSFAASPAASRRPCSRLRRPRLSRCTRSSPAIGTARASWSRPTTSMHRQSRTSSTSSETRCWSSVDTALRIHVHTDDPDRALALGAARGTLAAAEVVDMHEQIAARTHRLQRAACAAVAATPGLGNRRLFESVGAIVVDGATSPSPREFLAAVEADDGSEVILLPNDRNAVLAAEHAADHASKPAHVLPTRTIQAGLAALVAFDPSLPAAQNLEVMRAAADAVVSGGVHTSDGRWFGVVEGHLIAEGASFEEAVWPVVQR